MEKWFEETLGGEANIVFLGGGGAFFPPPPNPLYRSYAGLHCYGINAMTSCTIAMT